MQQQIETTADVMKEQKNEEVGVKDTEVKPETEATNTGLQLRQPPQIEGGNMSLGQSIGNTTKDEEPEMPQKGSPS